MYYGGYKSSYMYKHYIVGEGIEGERKWYKFRKQEIISRFVNLLANVVVTKKSNSFK